jgi:hypothetical protein
VERQPCPPDHLQDQSQSNPGQQTCSKMNNVFQLMINFILKRVFFADFLSLSYRCATALTTVFTWRLREVEASEPAVSSSLIIS